MPLAEGRVGVPGPVADGTPIEQRFCRTREQAVSDAHGHFHEAVYNQNRGFGVYTAPITNIPYVVTSTGVTPTNVIGVSALVAVYNPLGSGKNLSILKTTYQYLSGTLGSGVVYYVVHAVSNTPPTVATNGWTITPINNMAGVQTGAPVGIAVALPAGLGTPTYVLRPMLSHGAMTAESTTPPNPWYVVDLVDGEIEIPPGSALSIQPVLSAATGRVDAAITWEVVPG